MTAKPSIDRPEHHAAEKIFKVALIEDKRYLRIWLRGTADLYNQASNIYGRAMTKNQQRADLEHALAATKNFINALKSNIVQNLLRSNALADHIPPSESICTDSARELEAELKKDLKSIPLAMNLRNRLELVLRKEDAGLCEISHLNAEKTAQKKPQELVAQRILDFWYTYHADDRDTVTRTMSHFAYEVFKFLGIKAKNKELTQAGVETALRRALKNGRGRR